MPVGTLGAETVSVAGTVTVTLSPPEELETTELLVADRACAETAVVPVVLQACDAVVVPVVNQPELLPSPQLN